MKHSLIDEFAARSPFSTVDPRIKLLMLVAFLICAAVSTAPWAVTAVFLMAIAITIASRIPIKHLLSNFVIALPFLVAIALGAILTRDATWAALITARVTSSVLVALVFASATPVLDQTGAMRFFRVPKIFTSLMLLTYRFIFLFVDEIERMKMARAARGFDMRAGNIFQRWRMRILANTMGMLFVRVNDRASRVFDSLRSRGFNEDIAMAVPRRFSSRDALYTASIGTGICIVILIQAGVVN